MKVNVLFFASLRELTGIGQTVFETAEPARLDYIWSKSTGGKAMPANTLCALNMEYVKIDSLAADGDEVAFFPPVTGGQAGAIDDTRPGDQ